MVTTGEAAGYAGWGDSLTALAAISKNGGPS